jgi:hypothetical protein
LYDIGNMANIEDWRLRRKLEEMRVCGISFKVDNKIIPGEKPAPFLSRIKIRAETILFGQPQIKSPDRHP